MKRSHENSPKLAKDELKMVERKRRIKPNPRMHHVQPALPGVVDEKEMGVPVEVSEDSPEWQEARASIAKAWADIYESFRRFDAVYENGPDWREESLAENFEYWLQNDSYRFESGAEVFSQLVDWADGEDSELAQYISLLDEYREDIGENDIHEMFQDLHLYNVSVELGCSYYRRADGLRIYVSCEQVEEDLSVKRTSHGRGYYAEGAYSDDVENAVVVLNHWVNAGVHIDDIREIGDEVAEGYGLDGHYEFDFEDGYVSEVRYATTFEFSVEAEVNEDEMEAVLRDMLEEHDVLDDDGEVTDRAAKAVSEPEVVYDNLPDGFYVARLEPDHLRDEGRALGICVGNRQYGYGKAIQRGEINIFSLRTQAGRPKFTIEYDKQGLVVKQVKGKQNRLASKPFETQMLATFIYDYLDIDPMRVRDLAPGIEALGDEDFNVAKRNPPAFSFDEPYKPLR